MFGAIERNKKKRRECPFEKPRKAKCNRKIIIIIIIVMDQNEKKKGIFSNVNHLFAFLATDKSV